MQPTRDLNAALTVPEGAPSRTPLIAAIPPTLPPTDVPPPPQPSTTTPRVTPIHSSTPLVAPLPSKTPTDVAPQPTAGGEHALSAPEQPAPLFAQFTFGTSVEGRDLIGYRIGTGAKVVLLVGAVHGGFEANSAELVERLMAHFRDTPADVLPDVTLLLVPMLNPDGIARGRVLDGRFNANRVDLNRNWACGWAPTAYFRDQPISPGSMAFSEPETQALAALIQTIRPAAALFYHAAANGVYAGSCGGDAGSDALSAVYGMASGYSYGSDFSAYPVTGTAPAWVNSLGIPAADVELASATDPEFDRNLRGVMAVQYWLIEQR